MNNLIKIVKTSLVIGAVSLAGIFAFAQPTFATSEGNCKGQFNQSGDFKLKNGLECGKGGDVPQTLFGDGGIFTTIVNILLFLIGVLSVIMLIYGGIKYVISSGEASQVNSAKNTILYAIVGLVIAILAYAIVNFVVNGLQSQQ